MSNKPNPSASFAAILMDRVLAHRAPMTVMDVAELASDVCRLSSGFRTNALVRCNSNSRAVTEYADKREKRLESRLSECNKLLELARLRLSDRDPLYGLIVEDLDGNNLPIERV